MSTFTSACRSRFLCSIQALSRYLIFARLHTGDCSLCPITVITNRGTSGLQAASRSRLKYLPTCPLITIRNHRFISNRYELPRPRLFSRILMVLDCLPIIALFWSYNPTWRLKRQGLLCFFALFDRLHYDLTALQDISSSLFVKENYFKGVDLTWHFEEKVIVNVAKDVVVSRWSPGSIPTSTSSRRWKMPP